MLDSDVADWIASRTKRDISSILEDVERAYRHPYGFTAYRIRAGHVTPWQLRVHFWPAPTECYEYLHAHRTESQLIHAHGWDLLSTVVEGELEERTYEMRDDRDGDYLLYATAAVAGQRTSVLRATATRLSITSTAKTGRRPSRGAYAIPAGTYHSTLPATRSISLVATRQLPGQASHVAWYRATSDQVANETPEPPQILDSSSPPSEPQPWASFAFLFDRDTVLLARTKAQPQQWQPVGGRQEAADISPVDTLIRELDEEIGAQIDPSMLVWIGSSKADAGGGVVHFWGIKDFPLADLRTLHSNELVEARWWNISDARHLPMYHASMETLEQAARRVAARH